MVNIKDIAKHCGTSVSTVSRVINGHSDVSESTRQKVEAAIAEFNYIPNNSARNLVRARSDAVAVVVRGRSNPFFSSMIESIERDLYLRGYTMDLHMIDAEADEVKAAAMLVNERKHLGVVFLGGRFNYTESELSLLSVPFVCCTCTNTFGDIDAESYSSVTIDDRKAARKAVQHMIDLGHREIAALIVDENDKSISELRFTGYKEALAENGIEYDRSLVVCSNSFDMSAAYDAALSLLKRGKRFTALFTIADTMAIAAIKALVNSGMLVPDDVSVMAIDGLDLSSYTTPTLTTLEQPAAAMACAASNLLLDIIEGKAKNRHMVMETRLRTGASLARIERD